MGDEQRTAPSDSRRTRPGCGARVHRGSERQVGDPHSPGGGAFDELLPSDRLSAPSTGIRPEKGWPRRWALLASVALNSAFFLPDTVDVPVGTFRLDGYAYAGDDRAVSRVDVSIDSGATWTSTQLEEPTNEWTWQFWHADVYLTAGTHEVVVRAWDSTGALQPSDPEDVWNPKGT